MILALRSDKPEAELALYTNDGVTKIADHTWYAHRELSDTLLTEIESLLHSQQKNLKNLTGIVVYQGPGSFTGLRIGITIANTLAYSLQIPIASARDDGSKESWQKRAIQALSQKVPQESTIITPHYGAEAHITAPRK